jgi:hypothetical protein
MRNGAFTSHGRVVTDLRLALEDYAAANQEVDTLTCDEIVALYGPCGRPQGS